MSNPTMFKPGTLCLIIGEERGCEANIGATLTIVEKLEDDGDTVWTFEGASRPLVMLDGDSLEVLPHKVTHSDDDEDGYYYYMPQRHLMPIKGDDVGGEPQEVRKLPSDPATLAWARAVIEKVVAAQSHGPVSDLVEDYDAGRELAHRLTLRRFETS